eukprot:608004_1
MSRRDVIGEAGEQPNENDNLVELHKSEHPQNAQQIEEQIKDKHEQNNPSDKAKQHSISTYLVIFQWILLIFCVFSNIYLLSKPSVQCECDGSSAQSQIISTNPTTNPPTNHPTTAPITSYPTRSSIDPTAFPSFQPTPKPTSNPSLDQTMDPSRFPSSSPTISPSSNPSFEPTVAPTCRPSSDPSTGPTKQPTRHPSIGPTAHPSVSPSEYPSESPTYFDGSFVGDYKYSFRSTSHSFWLLCDGQWLDITQYSLLFDVIGFQFGNYYNSTNLISYFRVPDARDSVVGVIGSVHSMGERIGNETHSLSEREMPEHIHYYIDDGCCGECGTPQTGPYIGRGCTQSHYYAYYLERSATFSTTTYTSQSGANESFSLMQPTKFIGNLFVHSGEINS